MNSVSTHASTASQGVLERLRKRGESLAQEWTVRLNAAKSAFAAEMAWQAAQAEATPAPAPAEPLNGISGLLVDIQDRSIVRLQTGLNEVGGICLKVEGGNATLMDPVHRQTQAVCSGETFSAAGRRYQLKLFSFSSEVR